MTHPIEITDDSDEIETRPTEDLSCPVCGVEPEPAQRLGCKSCGTVHHQDCWTYNKGCARYACSAGPQWRALPAGDPNQVVAPDGKILLSHLSVGCYDGVYYAPPVSSLLTIVFELVALLGPAWGYPALFGWGLMAMCTTILWVALSSERYYLDLENRSISKAKALLGTDIFEWKVRPLSQISRLALVPHGEDDDLFLLAAVDRSDELLALAPPMRTEGEAFQTSRDLLARMKSNNVFPVEIPVAARLGAGREVLEILDSPILGEN